MVDSTVTKKRSSAVIGLCPFRPRKRHCRTLRQESVLKDLTIEQRQVVDLVFKERTNLFLTGIILYTDILHLILSYSQMYSSSVFHDSVHSPQFIIRNLMSWYNFNIGAAGTGKSHLLRFLGTLCHHEIRMVRLM